jgi:hypothetical protein
MATDSILSFGQLKEERLGNMSMKNRLKVSKEMVTDIIMFLILATAILIVSLLI